MKCVFYFRTHFPFFDVPIHNMYINKHITLIIEVYRFASWYSIMLFRAHMYSSPKRNVFPPAYSTYIRAAYFSVLPPTQYSITFCSIPQHKLTHTLASLPLNKTCIVYCIIIIVIIYCYNKHYAYALTRSLYIQIFIARHRIISNDLDSTLYISFGQGNIVPVKLSNF